MASRVAELASEEAERAEEDEAAEEAAHEPNTGDLDESEGLPDAVAPEPEPLTQERVEALFASLAREDQRHAREVEKRAGPMFADLAPCPACGPTAGFVFGAMPPQEAEAVLARVRDALGFADGSQYREATDKATCDACDGWGLTRTGSKVEAQAALPCSACNGQGWTHRLSGAQPPQFPPLQQVPNLVAPPQTNGGGIVTDPWNRPQGHPHYGVAPELVGV